MCYLRRANQIANWLLQPAPSIALRYGLALVSIAAALGIAQTFLHFHLPQPFTAFALSAIAVTFWYGGIGPGILAAVLASVLRTYFFQDEANAASRLLYDLVFLLFALLMSQGTRLRNELEARVAERTADLTRTNEELMLEIAERKQAEAELRESITQQKRAEEALRQAQADLAHVNRVTTMGELTASLAHEVNQPIAAAGTDASTCLRWLMRDQPDIEEAREAASRVVKDATRAAEIVSRIRLLFKKGTSQLELVDINEIIRGMVVLLRGEASRYSISFRTELAADLPQVMADPVQLQQLLMNLMINSIDAMKEVDGTRQLIINSRSDNEHLLISVSDTGVGLPPPSGRPDLQPFRYYQTQWHGHGAIDQPLYRSSTWRAIVGSRQLSPRREF